MISYLVALMIAGAMLVISGCTDANMTQPATDSTAEGLWTGTTNTGRTVTGAVLDDGTYYLFYSLPGASLLQIAGVIQGTGTSNSGSFTSGNAKDVGIAISPAQNANVVANYAPRQSFTGAVNYQAGGTVAFTTSYNTAYDTTPSFAAVAGTYQGTAGSTSGSQPATVNVFANGTFNAVEQSGCQFSGTATPRTRGNVFDITITFGTSPCTFAGSTFHGIAFFDIATHRLFAAAPNGTRTDAAIFFSTI
ncbi:MAG TPA: hypothetical protein VFS39_06160 [Nitrospira sp.]|nr:hypothetical protein [Nitrospira sp.]